jgi:formylglycine-generating enzyme required for sulfatase activity
MRSGSVKFSVLLLLAATLVVSAASLTLRAADGNRSVIVRLKGEDGTPGKSVELYKASYALLIGVSRYTAGLTNLPGVRQDVEDVKKLLEEHGFSTSILMDPSRDQLVRGIEDFINKYGRDQENRLFIYFAGHGYTLKHKYGGEMGYIIPSDAPRPDLDEAGFKAKALDMQRFESFAKTIDSKHVLFVFDSCFSGSVFEMVNRTVPEVISYKTANPVRQFLTSGGAGEKVPDKSIFKQELIEGLHGEADSDKDGYVTATELGIFLTSKVTNYSKGCQHPQFGTLRDPNLDKGDFVFQCGKAKVEPSAEAYKPVMPSGGGADLSELKKEAEKNREAKEKERREWSDWQGRFERAVSEAKALEQDPNLSAASKKKAWEKVQSGYPDDNPYGTKDDDLRQYAEGRISALDGKIAEEERLAEERRQAEEVRKAEAEQKAEERRQAEAERQAQAEARRQEAARKAAAAKKAASRPAASRPQQVAMGTMPPMITNAKDGSELIMIPAGEFLMGSPSGEGDNDEHPQHRVYLNAYYIGKYEVTNAQFARFVNDTGYNAGGDWKKYYNSSTADHPVVCVSWNDAKAYCNWSNLRLPTEAEWEKAARGTDGRKYPWGDNWDAQRCNWWQGPQLSGMANISNGRGTLSVGSFPSGASPYGCMDMAGNVWEWCNDWYGENYYSQSPQSNPEGPGSGSLRVLRGGSWAYDLPYYFRAAVRCWLNPDYWNFVNGFRVARSR